MYCVPGVTAERCRGVFWETGKLYKKDTSSTELTPSEYEALLGTLRSQRKSLEALRALAELGSNSEVGPAVARIRAEVRKTGSTVCRSLEEERYDAEYMLNELIAGLGDLDRLSMNPDSLPPGFTLSLLLKSTLCAACTPARPPPCLSRPPPLCCQEEVRRVFEQSARTGCARIMIAVSCRQRHARGSALVLYYLARPGMPRRMYYMSSAQPPPEISAVVARGPCAAASPLSVRLHTPSPNSVPLTPAAALLTRKRFDEFLSADPLRWRQGAQSPRWARRRL